LVFVAAIIASLVSGKKRRCEKFVPRHVGVRSASDCPIQTIAGDRIDLSLATFQRNNQSAPGFQKMRKESTMSKREEIAPNGDKRYIRRDEKGQIKTSVEEGASLSADSRHKAKVNAKPGEGDRGDHRVK
jgi:hypothetical protein